MMEKIINPENLTPAPRKRGGQPGNKNRLKSGFYARTWKTSETNGLDQLVMDGLDEEVMLLRVYIRRLVETNQENVDLKTLQGLVRTLSVACQTILRMLKAQSEIRGNGDSELRRAIDQAIHEITHEMGVDSRLSS